MQMLSDDDELAYSPDAARSVLSFSLLLVIHSYFKQAKDEEKIPKYMTKRRTEDDWQRRMKTQRVDKAF